MGRLLCCLISLTKNLMREFIKHIRSKPEPVRRQIILFISLILTALIVVFWVATLPYRFSKNNTSIKDDIKPFQALKNSIGGTLSK